MSNSRVITADFDYFAPETLDEALTIMQQGDVTPLAGGTDLLNRMKTEGIRPSALMYLMSCRELAGIRFENDALHIGAAARLADIEANPYVQKQLPALYKAVNVIGGTQIRNMATLVGNVCNASPGADTPPVLIVMGARCTVCRKNRDGGIERRSVPIEEMFVGVKRTILKPDELVTEVTVPLPKGCSGQSFHRLARVRLDIAKINCAVYVEQEEPVSQDGKRRQEEGQPSQRKQRPVKTVRICFGSVAPTPVRIPTVEAMIQGQSLTAERIAEVSPVVIKDIKPITDVRSTSEYRMEVAPVLLREALMEARRKMGES